MVLPDWKLKPIYCFLRSGLPGRRWLRAGVTSTICRLAEGFGGDLRAQPRGDAVELMLESPSALWIAVVNGGGMRPW